MTSTIKLVPIDSWTEKFNNRLTKGTTTITPDAPVKPITIPANMQGGKKWQKAQQKEKKK